MEDNKTERLTEQRATGRSSISSRFTPSLTKRMQSHHKEQANTPSNHPLPPSSSSSSLSSSFSSSSHQQFRNQANMHASSLPPVGKDTQRNGGHVGSSMNDSYPNKSFPSSLPNTPLSPSEEEPPQHFGRRMGRQTSWNENDKRPSSYYEGLKSDTERRDERMASLEALRRRREIPVSVRVRSSSLGRDRASILNDAMEPRGHEDALNLRGSRNILDLRCRSASLTRDANLGEPMEWSGKNSVSATENSYNTADQSILDRLLHKRERRENPSASKEGRNKLSRGDEENYRDTHSHSHRPQSLPLTSNLAQSWNGVEDLKDEVVQREGQSKKKGRRISRFLRPDFFDTPREESAFAKKKEVEAAAELGGTEKKQKEQHLMGGFLHSLEKRLDKLRGGERSKRSSLGDAEAVVMCEEPESIAPGCLTSTRLAAEVRKAKLIGTNEISNSDGAKKGGSRVDKAINSLLLREKGKGKKEVSESGLIKRAVGINERGPPKSRSSGELACLSVTGGALLGKPVVVQKNPMPVSGEAEVNGVGTENGVGGKFSSKVNSMLAMFRKGEGEAVSTNQSSRLRRTQSVAYEKSVPDDILSAIADHVSRNDHENSSVAKTDMEHKSTQIDAIKSVVKTEKVKKSSKIPKEKPSSKSKSSALKDKKTTSVKSDKMKEENNKEVVMEKSTQSASNKKMNDHKKDKVHTSAEKSCDSNCVKHAKSLKNEIIPNASEKNNEFELIANSSNVANAVSSERKNKPKSESKDYVNNYPIKSHIIPPKECRQEENLELLQSGNGKKLDRTSTQDSLDSSWSACSDVLADVGGDLRDRVKVSRERGLGLGPLNFADCNTINSNCLDSPSLDIVSDSGERVSGKGDLGGLDEDSEESVSDRIRRKSFYCRFNEVPSRRKSRVGRKSSASSLLYSASDHSWSPLDLKQDFKSHRRSSGSGRSSSSVSPASAMEGNSLDSSLLQLSYRMNAENKKPELIPSLSRDGFSPPPISYSRPPAIYRRSSTSPYQDRLPTSDPVHSIPLTTGLWATSSATSLARSNSSSRASEVDEEIRITGIRRGEESGHAQYIPSPLSPSSSMSNSYHNGISSSPLDEMEQDSKTLRTRKFGVTSLADGVTKPSPTHRKYNRYSSYSTSDGLTSVARESGPSLLTSEHLNPLGLPPLGISFSSKSRTLRNSSRPE